MSDVDPRQSQAGSISYLHLPAVDTRAAAVFYQAVFGWEISNLDSGRPSFSAGNGYVAGAWMSDQAVSREAGLLPYIYVDDIEATADLVVANGGEIVSAPYLMGDLRIATFHDPAGNLMGFWQDTAAD